MNILKGQTKHGCFRLAARWVRINKLRWVRICPRRTSKSRTTPLVIVQSYNLYWSHHPTRRLGMLTWVFKVSTCWLLSLKSKCPCCKWAQTQSEFHKLQQDAVWETERCVRDGFSPIRLAPCLLIGQLGWGCLRFMRGIMKTEISSPDPSRSPAILQPRSLKTPLAFITRSWAAIVYLKNNRDALQISVSRLKR